MKAWASVYSATGPGVPGTTGTPIFIAAQNNVRNGGMSVYMRFLTDGTSLGFVTERVDDLWAGTNKGQTSLLNLARELGVLRQETVAIQRVSYRSTISCINT